MNENIPLLLIELHERAKGQPASGEYLASVRARFAHFNNGTTADQEDRA